MTLEPKVLVFVAAMLIGMVETIVGQSSRS
jgi:hypothetical protein